MKTEHRSHSENKLNKAAKIVMEERIAELKARVFIVRGDSGAYTVTIIDKEQSYGTGPTPPRESCTCAWGRSGNDGLCSHVLSARALIASQNPVDPFAAFEKQDGIERSWEK